MLKQTFNMEDAYGSKNAFITAETTMVTTFFNGAVIGSFSTQLSLYVFEPIWNRYHRANINFDYDDEGVQDFKDNMDLTIKQHVVAFLTFTLHNIEYFKYELGTKSTPFQKQIISSIMPINQKVNQSLTATTIATGTTGQQLSEITAINSAWNKAFEMYYTENKQEELLDKFKWLFKKIINQYKGKYLINITGEDNYTEHPHIYYRESIYEDWIPIKEYIGYCEKTHDVYLKIVNSTLWVDDNSYNIVVSLNGTNIIQHTPPYDINEEKYIQITKDSELHVEVDI